jgi:hypothetical protein
MRRIVAICLATALVLSACGDDAPADTSAAPTTTTTTAAPTTTTTTTVAPSTADGVVVFHNGVITGGREFSFGPLSPEDVGALRSALVAALGEPARDVCCDPLYQLSQIGWNGFQVSFEGDGTTFAAWETYEVDASDPAQARLQIPCAESVETCRDQIGLGSTVGDVIVAVEAYRPGVGLDQWSWVSVEYPDASGRPPSIVIRNGNPEFGFICFQATDAFADPDSGQPGLDDWIIAIDAGPRCDAGVALDAP